MEPGPERRLVGRAQDGRTARIRSAAKTKPGHDPRDDERGLAAAVVGQALTSSVVVSTQALMYVRAPSAYRRSPVSRVGQGQPVGGRGVVDERALGAGDVEARTRLRAPLSAASASARSSARGGRPWLDALVALAVAVG